jgi:cytochrome c-type biogenesis protein CcmH
MKTGRSIILLIAMLTAGQAFAVEPDEILDDSVLEARAREISRELRCVTCQSQSIDESNAPLAKDLRLVVRERVLAGESNDEVIAYVTDRYGDYVRLKPAMRSDTALLWLTPGLALAGAIGVAFVYFRQLKKNAPASDDDDETEEETGA